jgi:hypothetical protein
VRSGCVSRQVTGMPADGCQDKLHHPAARRFKSLTSSETMVPCHNRKLRSMLLRRSDYMLIILNECCYGDLYEPKTWFYGATSRFHECISCTDNQISSLYTSLLPSSPSSSSPLSSPPLLSSSDSAAIMPRSSICPFASSQICIFQSLSPARF